MFRGVLRPVATALLFSALFFARSGHAQDAQALFDQGLTDMKAGRYKVGCLLIKRSLEIDPRAGTAFTLAECYAKAGRYASAVEMYDDYLSRYEGMTDAQKEQQKARAELSKSERSRLLTLVAWVTVKLPPSAPAGVVVTRDDESFPSSLLGAATAMDPGSHQFTTRAPDGPLIEQRVDVASGERKEMILEVRSPDGAELEGPPPASGEEPRPREAPDRVAHHTSPWVYVAGGVGAAGFVTAAIAGGLLLQKRSTINSECQKDQPNPDGSIPCSPAGKDAADLAKGTLAPITEVGLAVGAAGTIATVLLLVFDKPKNSSRGGTGVQPMATVSGSGATLGVRAAW